MRVEKAKQETKRFVALEGVRGLAAIVVVIHHFVLAFYPMLIGGPGSVQHTRFDDNLFGMPISLLYAGTFAVAIFFVLSGFVLSVGFFQTKSETIIKKLALKRYLRLMLPALAVTMICLVLIKLGFAKYISEAATYTGSGWLAPSWRFDASFLDALYSGAIGIFIQQNSFYDNVLWTMTVEFIGSFIVFGFVLLFGVSKHRWASYLILAAFTFNSWFLPFVTGMALADLYINGKLEIFKKKLWVFGLVLAAGLLAWLPSSSTALYTRFSQQFTDVISINYMMLYLTVAATLLIFAVLVGRRLSSWLEKPRISKLGKYTFSLYLIHIPVLYTVTVCAFLIARPHLGYNFAVLTAVLVSLPVVYIATVLFERYVDAPSVKFSSIVARMFENNESFGVKKALARMRRKVRKYQKLLLGIPTPNEQSAEQ